MIIALMGMIILVWMKRMNKLGKLIIIFHSVGIPETCSRIEITDQISSARKWQRSDRFGSVGIFDLFSVQVSEGFMFFKQYFEEKYMEGIKNDR